MARFLALCLRLSVIASAAAMLLLCAHAVHAQGFQPVPGLIMNPQNGPPQNGPPQNGAPFQRVDTTASPPLGLNGAPDPYAYYGPTPVQQNGYYSALRAPAAPAPPSYAAAPQFQSMAPPAQFQSLSQPMPGPAAPPAAYGYVLGPGDKLHVTVYDEPDLSGDYTVDGSGMVQLPLIGTLKAAGATGAALEGGIRNALANGYLKHPRVNVAIMGYRPFYVVGSVTKPGEYPYAENMTLLNAVALAGGFTDQAVQSTVIVRHEGSGREDEMPTDVPLLIRPGDVIRVKTTLFWNAMNMFSPLAGPAAIAAAAVH